MAKYLGLVKYDGRTQNGHTMSIAQALKLIFKKHHNPLKAKKAKARRDKKGGQK